MQINFLKTPSERKPSDWVLVGKAWPHKTKAGAFSGRFGIKTPDGKGGLVDTFQEISVKADDPIMIRPNQNQRADKKDPAYLLYMLKSSAK